MRDLLFLRHAETDMAGRFCGHTDPPINWNGKEQIRHLLATWKSRAIDAVYCSDLQRAFTTAQAVSQAMAVPLFIRPRLREIAFGEWEGLSWKEVEQRDRDYAQEWIDAFPHLPALGGEPFAAFEERVLDEIDELLAIASYKHFAVVSHGGVMRVVLRRLCACSEQEAWERTGTPCSFFLYRQGAFPREVIL